MTIIFISCDKDSSTKINSSINNTSGCGGQTTETDIDGNIYNVISIGNQCWFKENLKTTRYKNGVPIQTGLTNNQWQNANSGAYANYNDDINLSNIYGKIYNYYAAESPNGLCPTNWHVATKTDFDTLIQSIETIYGIPDSTAGGAMKEIGITHWSTPNNGATNLTQFTALPGGYRNNSGLYQGIGGWGIFIQVDNYWGNLRFTIRNGVPAFSYYGLFGPEVGGSVRCVKD